MSNFDNLTKPEQVEALTLQMKQLATEDKIFDRELKANSLLEILVETLAKDTEYEEKVNVILNYYGEV